MVKLDFPFKNSFFIVIVLISGQIIATSHSTNLIGCSISRMIDGDRSQQAALPALEASANEGGKDGSTALQICVQKRY